MLAGQSLNPNDDVTLFIRDALRFISAFIVPISQCAAHVYLSALPFAPEQSHVARKFCLRFPNTLVVTQGKPSQWSMAVFTAEHLKEPVSNMAFSPDESTFLSGSQMISPRLEGITYICDSETGRCISGLFHHADDARFSPAGKHILLRYRSYVAVWDIETSEEQFRIEGSDFAFVHHDRRIASMKKDRNSDDSGDKDASEAPDRFWATGATRILVQFWDAGNGELISSRLLEVNGVDCAQFSPDGRFLAIQKKSEDIIELWNLEDSKDFRQFTGCLLSPCFSPDGRFLAIRRRSEDIIELRNLEDSKDFRRFTYPHGNFTYFCFPTSGTLMAVSWEEHQIHLWRLDTQEMTSFSHDSFSIPHVIDSPHTTYLFIQQDNRVEIWGVSATGSKMIWKTVSPSRVMVICPSRNGHRVLVAYDDRSVRMWNLDLENLAMNQADTMDTRNETDVPRVVTISPSGKMVVTRSQQSSNVEFLDTTTGEVVARKDIKGEDIGENIAFSSNEDQAVFLYKSLTIYDIMHPEKRVSFNPWPRKNVRRGKVAFQTCNDLVICVIFDDESGLLQVWHRQDPTGFECTYSFPFKRNNLPDICLAPDGLTVVIMPRSSLFDHDTAQVIMPSSSYSWNPDTAKFHPVCFEDQVHISRHPSLSRHPSPEYSPDGELFACLSKKDSHVRVWDTRTGHRVSMFLTPEVDEIALSPALTHSLGERLIALSFRRERAICLFNAHTGRLHAQILGKVYKHMAFIRDGTALANYDLDSGVIFWEIADLIAKHQHSTHGYELMMEGMMDGWVMGQDDEPLFWVPVENRKHLYVPPFRVVIEGSQMSTIVDLSNSRLCGRWTECIDKGWLKELEQKEKDVGRLLE